MRIVVSKRARRLTVRQGRRILFCCRVQLGSRPVGAKRAEGDGRTPEGAYRVCSRNPKSKFHLAMGVSYPNANDARLALRAGRIDAETAGRVRRAERKGARPPWDTPLGGWIMLHGQPNGGARTGDWTAGCVAVSDADIEWLYARIPLGARIVIRP